MDKSNNDECNSNNFTTVCKIENFIKIDRSYPYLSKIREMPDEIKKYTTDCNNIPITNKFIKLLFYNEDKINDVNKKGTGHANMAKERKNNFRKKTVKKHLNQSKSNGTNIKTTKSTKSTKPVTITTKRKEDTIANLVTLIFSINGNVNEKIKIYLLGLRIANKNIRTIKKLKKCVEKLLSNKNFENSVTLELVKILDPNTKDNSDFEVNLRTNTTKESNGFFVYSLVIVNEKEKMLESEIFSLLSFKQFSKRTTSLLERHKKYMESRCESLYPFFFKSMFYRENEKEKFKLKNIFDFNINFYYDEEFYGMEEEVLMDLIPFNPILEDVPFHFTRKENPEKINFQIITDNFY